ncbi:hypothetical protein GCM10010174_18300 [Kutzneria viridogrisea]|uniref:Amino acid adenylation domain-containing protein n=1 Tax=Kutzneria viridogrisea TaxID=47990 RepID=A0ABR6B7X7_9PSEU|nr:amino acid adenylation domain-containing protein [Kutzneria viridogrisea]
MLTEQQADLAITESQKGLLVLDSRVAAKHLYNQIIQFDLDPAAVPAEAVGPALLALVAVQPALRQVFTALPAIHARLTAPPTAEGFPLTHLDVPPQDYPEAVAALARELGPMAFDLATGPAYRFGTVRATDNSAATILLVGHHIVGDGVSMGPIVRDLEALFTGRLAGEAIAAKQVERETALRKELQAQNRVAAQDRTTERAKQWAAALREVPPLVLQPRPNRPTQTAFTGARVAWRLDEAESARFTQTCKRLGVTSFVLLSGVYGAVLARHGAVSKVLVGSPFMARRTIGAFDLCGFFVNTLPVTVDVDWARTVDEHLAEHVRPAIDFCRSHVDVSFNQLVEHAQPDRSSNRNPLFSAMLAMQDTFDPATAQAVVRVREPGNGTAKFDLWLGATPIDGRWQLELEYDRELISPAVADGLLDSLRTALRRAVADGSRTLAELFEDAPLAESLRTDGQPARVEAATLSQWFEQSVAATPQAVAIEDPHNRLTYAELAAAATTAAAGLAAHGIGPGDVVGLALDTLADTVVAIMAILRRGAVFLPLDSGLPTERLAYMADKAGCRTVLGAPLVPDLTVLNMAELAEGGTDTSSLASADSPVYVMFTSGSTGQPKGVQMGHGPLLNLTGWQHAALRMGRQTRFLQYAPLGFDVSYQEILPTLLCGGTVVSREPADRRDFPAMLRRIADTAVTHVYLPVAALRPLVQCAKANQVSLPALRYLCVSGEQLLVDEEIREFFVAHPHCTLVNLYGPTETHAVTSHRLSARDEQWPPHVPIGLPYPNVAAYVVDVTGHLAPVGVPGELYLGGDCPAEGYVNDPQITAERFVADRFDGGTAYRTGDRVVREPDGVLVFLGREDTQVKIRGYRVELGEIQTVATAVYGVLEAVAVARGSGVDRELALFVLGEGPVDHEALRAKLAEALPEYMVPTWIFDLDRVPTTPTGKTDLDALVALADELVTERRIDSAAAPADYQDALEAELAGIWAEVLGVDSVLRDRPVMAYGAHSLNIFTALAQVQERYGVPVPVVDFFSSPTVATLAGLVRTALAGA